MNRFIIVLVTLVFSQVIYCASSHLESRTKEEKLSVLNSLNPITATSLFDPIELYINEKGNLRVQFNRNVGEISIQIIDPQDTPFYEYTVHSDYETQLNIQSSLFPSGMYAIYLYLDDYYIYAQFQIE